GPPGPSPGHGNYPSRRCRPRTSAADSEAFGPSAAAAAAAPFSSASISANTSIGAGAFARNTQVSQTASRNGGIFKAISTQPSWVVSAHQYSGKRIAHL